MNITTSSVDGGSISVHSIGLMMHTMLVKYLANLWPLSDEAVDFPLTQDQQDRLLKSLDANELTKLDG